MNKYLFEQFSQIFNKGEAFSIMLVLQQERPAFYDSKGLSLQNYKKLGGLMKRIRMSYPYLETFTTCRNKYKVVIFDNTKNSLDYVKKIYEIAPLTKGEIKERIRKEAKLFGYPTVLINVENIVNSRTTENITLTWYYITYILTEKGRKVGDIYTFFCKEDDFEKIIDEVKLRKEIYNKSLGNLSDYSVLICIEKKLFQRVII